MKFHQICLTRTCGNPSVSHTAWAERTSFLNMGLDMPDWSGDQCPSLTRCLDTWTGQSTMQVINKNKHQTVEQTGRTFRETGGEECSLAWAQSQEVISILYTSFSVCRYRRISFIPPFSTTSPVFVSLPL